jgi:stage II sporulation protein R
MFKKFVILMLLTLVICAEALTLRVYLEQEDLASRLIRLHVVAASDAPEDQARKLTVRDALLPELEALTADCADAEAAAAAIESGLSALAETAARTLGTGETAAASLTWESFPRRDYGSFSLPAGTYRALRIILGAGEGRNWWCVAFPALCLPAAEPDEAAAAFEEAAAAAGLTDGQIELMTADTETVRFKFRLLDWLGAVFGS